MTLALGWRNAADHLPAVPRDIGDLMLGVSTAYFIWFLMFYAVKVLARPRVLMEDMRTPPARAGIAAMAMSMMVLAAALLPLDVSVPPVWWTGVIMQIAASAVVLVAIWKDPPEKRHFSTFQYFTFVGPVVGPVAGIPLGYVRESLWLITAALVAWVIITIGIFATIRSDPIPERLRPSVMLFLAPICLFALGYGGLGYERAFAFFYWLGNGVMVVLLFLVPWMIRGGYSPAWAAFAFPVGAFLNVQVLAHQLGYEFWPVIGIYATMALGSPLVLWLAYRFMMCWVTGELARDSHAAIA